jgi:hypothetical protein
MTTVGLDDTPSPLYRNDDNNDDDSPQDGFIPLARDGPPQESASNETLPPQNSSVQYRGG